MNHGGNRLAGFPGQGLVCRWLRCAEDEAGCAQVALK